MISQPVGNHSLYDLASHASQADWIIVSETTWGPTLIREQMTAGFQLAGSLVTASD